MCATHDEWYVCKSTMPKTRQTVPWSIVQRAWKTQGLPLVSPTDSHHHVFSTCHFVRGTYAKARRFVSNTCHPQLVPRMQEHNTYVAHNTCQTQASGLLIIKGPQNPSFVLVGKPRHSSTSLTKLKVHPWWALIFTKFHLHGNSRYVRSVPDNLSYS